MLDRLRVGSWPGREFTHNPFVGNLCDALERQNATVVDLPNLADAVGQRLDVVQMHWGEQVLWGAKSAPRKWARLAKSILILARLKASGTRVAWFAHNLVPHDPKSLSDRLLWQAIKASFTLSSDLLITLSPDTVAAVARVYRVPFRSIRSIRMPAYPPGPERRAAREKLGLASSARLLVFFGDLRPNKGVVELIEAMRLTTEDALRLQIVGQVADPAPLLALAYGDPRIVLIPARADEETLAQLVAAADFAVLPLGQQLHSGSLIYALSKGTPVITREGDFSRGLQRELGEDWVHLYSGELRLSKLPEPPLTLRPNLHMYQIDRVAHELLSIYVSPKSSAKAR